MRPRQALSLNEHSPHEPCFKRLGDGRHDCCLRFDLCCGVAFGRVPTLRIDRAGISLVGASLMIGLGSLSLSEALKTIDLDAIALLLDRMIIAGQLRVSGFYALSLKAGQRAPSDALHCQYLICQSRPNRANLRFQIPAIWGMPDQTPASVTGATHGRKPADDRTAK
jgi:hypothetical protein